MNLAYISLPLDERGFREHPIDRHFANFLDAYANHRFGSCSSESRRSAKCLKPPRNFTGCERRSLVPRAQPNPATKPTRKGAAHLPTRGQMGLLSSLSYPVGRESNRVQSQVIFTLHGSLVFNIAFMIVSNLRIQATMTTLLGLPVCFNRDENALRLALHWMAERVAMYGTTLTSARPPQTDRLPWCLPLSLASGATPARAAISRRFNVPNSGHLAIRVTVVPGQGDDHLDFMMKVFRGRRIRNVVVVDDDRVGRLGEENRMLALDLRAHLLRVFGVVAADAIDAVNRKAHVGSGNRNTRDGTRGDGHRVIDGFLNGRQSAAFLHGIPCARPA